MKKRKTFMGVALLVAVLMLGIGYAVLTDSSLKISGSASADGDTKNFKVNFTEFVADNTSTVTPTGTASGKTATFNVEGMTTKGQVAKATYTITNQSEDLVADIALGTITNDKTDFFKVETTIAGNNDVAPGEAATVTVTVTLLKTPVDKVSGTFTIPFTATADEAA